MDNSGNEDRSLPAYHVQDLILQHTRTLARSEIQTTLTINNLLSTQYVSNGYTYGYIVGQRIDERFYYPQAGRMIWLGLKVSV